MSGLILYILSIILLIVFNIPAILYKMGRAIRHAKKWKHFEIEISLYFRDLAVSLDQYGNVVCGPIMNDTFIRGKDKYLFGHPDDTISLVLAKNIRGMKSGKDIRITWLGRRIVGLVRRLDPGHFLKTLKNPENN